MLVNSEKMNFEAGKTNAKDPVAKSSPDNSTAKDAKTVAVGLSEQGQHLNSLYQLSLSYAKQNPSPVYIAAEKRVELLANSVNELAKQSGYEYTPEQIKRVVEDVAKETNIRQMPRADVNASSGSVYAFLSSSDKATLADAYQYALDNNTSLDDVRTAAFSLARSRYIEAKINSGTTWAVHNPNENVGDAKPKETEQQTVTAGSRNSDSDYIKSLLQQLAKGQLFASNPYLRISLLQDTASAQLNNTLPSFLKEKISAMELNAEIQKD